MLFYIYYYEIMVGEGEGQLTKGLLRVDS